MKKASPTVACLLSRKKDAEFFCTSTARPTGTVQRYRPNWFLTPEAGGGRRLLQYCTSTVPCSSSSFQLPVPAPAPSRNICTFSASGLAMSRKSYPVQVALLRRRYKDHCTSFSRSPWIHFRVPFPLLIINKVHH